VNRKIVDLLVQVLQWIGEGQQDQADIQAMIEDLLQSGFEQSDIQMVLNWVQDRLSTAGLVYQAAPLSSRSQRVLHSMESTTIRPDLLRFLLELKNRQLINAGRSGIRPRTRPDDQLAEPLARGAAGLREPHPAGPRPAGHPAAAPLRTAPRRLEQPLRRPDLAIRPSTNR
jgi:hypothetical protein